MHQTVISDPIQHTSNLNRCFRVVVAYNPFRVVAAYNPVHNLTEKRYSALTPELQRSFYDLSHYCNSILIPNLAELSLIVFRSLGVEFERTNRGGLITFHGPGQLVAYPVISLKHFRLGMKAYIGRLEDTIISACRSFSVTAETSREHTGVWIGDSKIAAIGKNMCMSLIV